VPFFGVTPILGSATAGATSSVEIGASVTAGTTVDH
jgi:hypothetical protein